MNWERGKWGKVAMGGTNAVVEASQAIVTQDMREGAKHALWTIYGAGLQPDLCSSHMSICSFFLSFFFFVYRPPTPSHRD